jgi:hypothetical protein
MGSFKIEKGSSLRVSKNVSSSESVLIKVPSRSITRGQFVTVVLIASGSRVKRAKAFANKELLGATPSHA